MASSLLLLLDDIATVLDDVSAMTKVAAKKTAGVLGDDLALNAEQVTGVKASRELPVVWQVAKGSTINKIILVPAALIISEIAPWLVAPLLMLGGTYLCYEGVEKVLHSLAKDKNKVKEKKAHKQALHETLIDPKASFMELEKAKIKGAIRTDFILSAEIIVISLGAVAEAEFVVRLGVLCTIAALITVGVYGLVAAIVRLDDWGIALCKKDDSFSQTLGESLLAFAPILMKTLSIAGTAAMFLVGGGILGHGIPALEHLQYALTGSLQQPLAFLVSSLYNGGVGIVLGLFAVGAMATLKRFKPSSG